MMTPIITSLAFVGVVTLGAFLASVVFQRYRLPDIVFLLGMGVLLGPVAHVVDPAGIRSILPFVSTLAVIIILFDGGLEIKMEELREGVVGGTLMAFAVFLTTTFVAGLVIYQLGVLSLSNALLLA